MQLLFSLYNSLKKYKIIQVLKDWLYQTANKVLDSKLKGGFINSDINEYDLITNKALVELQKSRNFNAHPVKSMTWFVPAFSEPHAGMNNIFEFIRYLMDKGVNINIVLLANKVGVAYCQHIINTDSRYNWLKQTKIFNNTNNLPYTDAGVATACDTAYSLLKYNKTLSKFYFIQDDERLLYKDTYKQKLAENTYRFGFSGIATAKCLETMYKDEFGGKCESYFTALNIQRPYVLKKKDKIRRLFFYARPEKEQERNGFKIGFEGLKEIKKRHGELEIVTAGSNMRFNDEGIGIIQLGNISLDKIKEFYLSCDVGMSILLSKHTGVIPFELMATSVAVMTNKQPYIQDYLWNKENCMLFDMGAESIADAFDILYKDINFYNGIVRNGYNTINNMEPVEEEIARISKKLFGV